MSQSDMRDLEREFIRRVLRNKSRVVQREDDRRVKMTSSASCSLAFPKSTCLKSRARQQNSIAALKADPMRATGIGLSRLWPTPTTLIRSWWLANPCAHDTPPARSEKDPRRCLRRWRGRLGTKVLTLINQDGLPARFELTPCQAHDAPKCKQLPDALQPGQRELADKVHDADWIWKMIWKQCVIDEIPSKANRRMRKDFAAKLYKERNTIERVFGRMKASFQRIATRNEKTSRNCPAMLKLASVTAWIEFYEADA
jgi:transposase